MTYLADTNILLRYLFRSHVLYPMVRNAVRKLRTNGHELDVASQNLVEFWNVATRPVAQNGFGKSLATAERALRRLEKAFPLLDDSRAIYAEWRRLVVTYSVSGIQVHDARLVAAMIVHSITHILTFNTADFARYAPLGIIAVDPATV